ncbi:hypothetical protein KFU94_67885 [Chloroflexi bacterium TSY]|nr:hypothetical protein [Chloroflexi bacterium TSY]
MFAIVLGQGNHVAFAQVSDEQIRATLTTRRTELTIGDVISLTLQVDHPAGYRVLPLPVDAEHWGAIEIRDQSVVTVVDQAGEEDDKTVIGSEMSTQQIDVTFWSTGAVRVPLLPVTVADTEGNLVEVATEPLTLTVMSVLIDGDDALRDLKPQATLPLPLRWPWVVAGLLVLGVLASLFWWLLRRRRGRTVKQIAQPLPALETRRAHEIALHELARIEKLNLPTEMRFKDHYTLTTDVLRRYLEDAYQISALEQTTEEIRQAIKPLSFAQREKSRLLNMLEEADFVKFAEVVPEQDEAQQLPDMVRQIVLAIKPHASESPIAEAEDESI